MTASQAQEYFEQMRRAAKDATDFVDGMSEPEFLADRKTQQAVLMSLLIIGEAVAKLMDRHLESANGRPDVPWHAMRGMRNRIAHGYFDIDFHVVGSTVQIALPELLERLTESPADPEPP